MRGVLQLLAPPRERAPAWDHLLPGVRPAHSLAVHRPLPCLLPGRPATGAPPTYTV